MGKWETLVLVFHFSIRPVAGAWGMWESRRFFGEIPKGLVERGGKPVFGFPRFPQTRHFHSSLFAGFQMPGSFALCLTFRLLIHLGVLHPITRDVQFNNHAVVHQSVDGCRRHHGVFEDCFPL